MTYTLFRVHYIKFDITSFYYFHLSTITHILLCQVNNNDETADDDFDVGENNVDDVAKDFDDNDLYFIMKNY